MPIPIYQIKNLNISKKNKSFLRIKQFDVFRGACYIFEGRMGSGKTTLLEILYSRKKIHKGSVIYEEKDLLSYSAKEYDQHVGIVPQIIKQPRWGSVKNYMIKNIRKHKYIANPYKRLEDIVAKMQINYLLDKKIKLLTPGQLRWVVLATKIAADTKILFIDEFEQHLSKEDIKKLINILYRKIKYDGITLIASTQNKDYFNRLSTVMISLENGRITSLRSNNKKRYKKK